MTTQTTDQIETFTAGTVIRFTADRIAREIQAHRDNGDSPEDVAGWASHFTGSVGIVTVDETADNAPQYAIPDRRIVYVAWNGEPASPCCVEFDGVQVVERHETYRNERNEGDDPVTVVESDCPDRPKITPTGFSIPAPPEGGNE